jgi:hypothetical protein
MLHAVIAAKVAAVALEIPHAGNGFEARPMAEFRAIEANSPFTI